MIKALGFCFPRSRQLNSTGREVFKENVCLHGAFAYQLKETMELQKIKQKLEEDKTVLLQEKVSALVLILFHSPPGRGTSVYRCKFTETNLSLVSRLLVTEFGVV